MSLILKNSKKGNAKHQASHLWEAHYIDHLFGRVQRLVLAELKRKWRIIVDTSSLLDMESRKDLKQLEGIKETRMIIPITVIWEIDCLKCQKTSNKHNCKIPSHLEDLRATTTRKNIKWIINASMRNKKTPPWGYSNRK